MLKKYFYNFLFDIYDKPSLHAFFMRKLERANSIQKINKVLIISSIIFFLSILCIFNFLNNDPPHISGLLKSNSLFKMQ